MSARATDEQPIRSVRGWDDAAFWARCRRLPQVFRKRPFVRGVLHGTVCNYENGVEREEIAYRRGKRHGLTRRFDANGALEKTTEWKQGKPVLGKAP